MKGVTKYLFGAIILLYPLLVFSALVIFKFKIRYLSVLLILLSIAYIVFYKHNYHGRHRIFVIISPAILFIIGAFCFVMPFFVESEKVEKVLLKVYPALADMVYLTIMGTSLFIPPNMVYTLVNLFDKSLKIHLDKEYFARYCRNSAIVWCVFFLIDASISLYLSFNASDLVWAVYSSGVTYFVMGLIFTAQYVFIKMIESYIIKVIEKNPPAKEEEKLE